MSRMPPTGSRSISPECCDDRRRILAWFVAIAAFVAPLDAQETRVFDGAPPASWVAPPGCRPTPSPYFMRAEPSSCRRTPGDSSSTSRRTTDTDCM